MVSGKSGWGIDRRCSEREGLSFGSFFWRIDCRLHCIQNRALQLSDFRRHSVLFVTRENDGILMAALSEEDLKRVSELIADLRIVRFDCGQGIHMEKPKEFIELLLVNLL